MSRPCTSFLETNLAAHQARWGFVPVRAAAVDTMTLRVEETGGAWPRITLRVPDGRWLRLHSDRQPIEEATRLLGQAPGDVLQASLVCLIGAGYGYVLDQLERAAAPTVKILLVEPEPACVQLLLGRRDWTALIAAGRLMVLAGPAFTGRTEVWRLVTPDAPDPLVLAHPVIAGAYGPAVQDATRLIAQAVAGARANDEARRQFAGRYLLNTLRNLAPIVYGADPTKLAGQFGGTPAFVVGAGPSLDATLPDLGAVHERGLVIAADTAWRPLVRAGIDPGLVVGADPSSLNGRHLIDVPSRRDTWLVAEGSVDPGAMHALAGRVAAYRVADHHPWPWFAGFGVERPLVRVWGSVLTAALDLALTLGCDPIIFVGADLAYTNNQTYCRGTSFEEDWARGTSKGMSLRQIWDATLAARQTEFAPGLDGREVRTAAHLIEFRNWLVARTSEHTDRRFVNATGAGLLFGPRIEQLALQSVLANAPVRDVDVRARLRQCLQPATPHDRAQVFDALASLERMARGSADASGALGDWLHFGRPSLTRTAIADALADAQRTLADASTAPRVVSVSPARVDLPALSLHHADRAALRFAQLHGTDAGLDGIVAAALPESRDAADARALQVRILDALLDLHPLLETASADSGVVEPDTGQPAPWHPLLSHRYNWRPDAARLLAALDEVALSARTTHPIADAAVQAGQSFWTTPILPQTAQDDAESSAPSAPALEMEARLSLLRERILLDGAEVTGVTTEARQARRLTELMLRSSAWLPVAGPGGAGALAIEVAGARVPWPLPVDRLMRVLTGTVASATLMPRHVPRARHTRLVAGPVSTSQSDRQEPRLAYVMHPVAVCEPEVLTDDGFPYAWTCVSDGERGALVTPAASRRSYRLSAAHAPEACPEWPVQINGEVPYGPPGGTLAWSVEASVMMIRERPRAEPNVIAMPFRPAMVAVDADGVAWCLAREKALWRWRPGTDPERMIDTPECLSLQLDGDAVWLATFRRDATGRIVREDGYGRWQYDRVSGTHGHAPVQSFGYPISASSSAGWTARARPCIDTIELTHDDGAAFLLAAYAPVRVAFCGSSLVATCEDGSVLLFRALVAHVDALRQTLASATS